MTLEKVKESIKNLNSPLTFLKEFFIFFFFLNSKLIFF